MTGNDTNLLPTQINFDWAEEHRDTKISLGVIYYR